NQPSLHSFAKSAEEPKVASHSIRGHFVACTTGSVAARPTFARESSSRSAASPSYTAIFHQETLHNGICQALVSHGVARNPSAHRAAEPGPLLRSCGQW